jgi:hypothetical protein
MASRIHLVVGYQADGTPKPLYLGGSGSAAAEAFDGASSEELASVEIFRHLTPSKRRRFQTSGDEPSAKPAKAKKGKPAKAESKE